MYVHVDSVHGFLMKSLSPSLSLSFSPHDTTVLRRRRRQMGREGRETKKGEETRMAVQGEHGQGERDHEGLPREHARER